MSAEAALVGTSNQADAQPLTMTSWSIAILVACAVAWLGYNFPPVSWRIPDDMTHIGALSPPADQARLKAVETANKWKNTLLKFSLAGLGIGLSGCLLYASKLGKHAVTAGVTLVVGLVAGALSGTISLVVRQYLDLEYPIPMISQQMRPLFCDSVVFAIGSAILLAPISVLLFMQPSVDDRQKAISLPLAGLLTGLVVPIIAATVLSTHTNTSFFPPLGLDLTLVWFGVLAAMALLMLKLAGKKTPAAPEPAPPQVA